jgi:hypothetical protein
VDSLDVLQRRLGAALAANGPGSGREHVLIALPSVSVGGSLLSHDAERIPSLEHRSLLYQLVLRRIEHCQLVFVAEGGLDARLEPVEGQCCVRLHATA